MAFAQDYILEDLTSVYHDTISHRTGNKVFDITAFNYKYVYEYGNWYAFNEYNNTFVPKPIMERYLRGRGMYKGGAITLSLGIVGAFIGSLFYLGSSKADYIIATTLVSTGGTAVEIGIPLMCFGSHIKNESIHEYELFRDGYFLAPIPATDAPKTATETPSELPTPDL